MDKKRREIIVNEIEYWESNRLLPAHYCQYLLTLYTEGAGKENFKKKINPPKPLILAILFFVFALAISLLIHTFELSFGMKVGISASIYAILAAVVFYIKKETIWYSLYLALYNIGIFFSLIFFSNDLNFSNPVMLGIALGFIVLLYLQGIIFKLRSLKIASLVSLLGVVGVVIYLIIQ